MSNFAAVRAGNGQNVTMFGMITEFKGEGVSQKSGKPWKKVIINDGTERHTVTLRGTLPDISLINQKAQFALSTWQGQQGTGYSGFWNSNTQVNQQPQGRPPIELTKEYQKLEDADYRQKALQAACVLFSNVQGEIVVDDILITVKRFTNYILTGKSDTTFAQDQNLPEDDSLQEDLPPWENS